LLHPISEQTKNLMELDDHGRLRSRWGRSDIGRFCFELHEAARIRSVAGRPVNGRAVRVVDHLDALTSAAGARAEGRIYEIPMDARSIVEDPARAMDLMDRAVEDAIDWGARIVGLGSMTGIIGNRGAYLAERHPVAVTTGNSLTIHATMRNLEHYCEAFGLDLAEEVLAVVGIPGSIATGLATLLAPRCRRLILAARRSAPQAVKLADRLDSRLELDLPTALAEASMVIAATSSGDCIDPAWLRPGALILDVGVPGDVRRVKPARRDVLILSAGYSRVPEVMPRDSFLLRFFQGIVPSCLGETIVLSLEDRAESYSIGRELDLDRVREIGRLAEAHGFRFSDALAFGLPLGAEEHARFLKVVTKSRSFHVEASACDCVEGGRDRCRSCASEPPDLADLAGPAADRYARHINPVLIGMGRLTGLTRTFVSGRGVELFDESGRAYLDFVAGFGSLNLGHNHPRVVAGISSAMQRLAPGFTPASVNPLAAALAERLVAVTPDGLEMVFFTSSGAESVEAAVKLARAASGRTGLLSCHGSYHGKTLGALSVSGRRAYQEPFGPLLPDCQAIPYGELAALESALATRRHAAFIVEPIQGEAGMITPPRGYLEEAHRLCRRAGTLFIADEVQTGLGRTGPLFAVEREGVEPDIMTLAKSLGGGLMPLGAMLARRDLWLKAYGSYQTFALHSSTFSGGSLACAAGLAALQAITDGAILPDAVDRGHQLRSGLESIARDCPMIREVRGRGLMLGVEFHPLSPTMLSHFKGFDESGVNWWLVHGHDDLLRTIPAIYVQTILLHEYGIYTQPARSNPQVLRIQPPLIIREAHIERFLEALRATCAEWITLIESAEAILSKSLGELDRDLVGS
jgi:acetylornithine/succinyldiaminopimelate/putrescine aminotransferase/predicted amino acid dehydrogenase